MQIKWWNSKLTSDLSHVIHIIKRWKQTASRPSNYRRKQLFPLNSGLNHRFLQFETNFKATFSGICYRTRPHQLISHPDYIGPIDLIHVCLSLSNTCFFYSLHAMPLYAMRYNKYEMKQQISFATETCLWTDRPADNVGRSLPIIMASQRLSGLFHFQKSACTATSDCLKSD